MSFVKLFLDYTKDCESPTDYFKWSAYTVIGAAMRDNCYLSLATGRVFPNIYTILLSKGSSRTRKSVPLKRASEILRAVRNTKVISGRTSFQSALETLSMPDTDSKGIAVKGASCLLYTEELRAFFVDDKQLLSVLTNLYDYHEEWDNNLIRLKSKLRNVCVSFLGGSNEAYLKDIYTNEAVFGGLLARTFIIAADKKRKYDSLMYSPPPDKDKFHRLCMLLSKITTMRGEFKIDDIARKCYDEWYHDWNHKLESTKYLVTGVEDRIHTSVLKIAMILAGSEIQQPLITRVIMEKAIEECLGILSHYKMLVATISGTQDGTHARVVLQQLLLAPKHRLTKKEILTELWGSVSNEALDKVIETFYNAGIISLDTVDGQVTYRLTPETIESYFRALGGKGETIN